MRIKDVEAIVGITKKNIRFYEDAGLLTPQRNAENKYREYSMDDVERLRKVKLLRKLDMPVSDIRDLLNGSLSLPAAAKRHDLYLEHRMESINQARTVCKELSESSEGISELNAEAMLMRMEHMETTGLKFTNVEKRDVKRKYTGAVVACAVIVAFMCGIIAFVIWLSQWNQPSWWTLAILLLFPFVTAVGSIMALISRIKEIREGEENDLSNY